jgi:DNA gyrase/topoisomerase IV subunit B
LKGKVINAAAGKDVLKNEEMKEMIQAIGTGIGQHFDISKIKYSKVIIATDNDFDGFHIRVLLVVVLATILPDIIKKGFLYVAETPLYSIRNSDKLISLWSDKEIEEARKMGKNIFRAKGLGEYSPAQLKSVLLDEKNRRLTKIIYSKDMDKIVKLMTSPEEKRKLLNSSW